MSRQIFTFVWVGVFVCITPPLVYIFRSTRSRARQRSTQLPGTRPSYCWPTRETTRTRWGATRGRCASSASTLLWVSDERWSLSRCCYPYRWGAARGRVDSSPMSVWRSITMLYETVDGSRRGFAAHLRSRFVYERVIGTPSCVFALRSCVFALEKGSCLPPRHAWLRRPQLVYEYLTMTTGDLYWCCYVSSMRWVHCQTTSLVTSWLLGKTLVIVTASYYVVTRLIMDY